MSHTARAEPAQLAMPLLDRDGHFDSFGRDYCLDHSAEQRRAMGVTLTPEWLVRWMLGCASVQGQFDRVIDPGCGTARFALMAAQRWPHARVIGIEALPELAALARRAISETRLGHRVDIEEADFRGLEASPGTGKTLYIGNPPYVRHHDVDARWKDWYRVEMARLAIDASALAGLHAHFLLKTALLARPGDAFCYVIPAEWLDTGYGDALRQLLAGDRLPVAEMWLADKDEPIFDGALVSSVVIAGRVGEPTEKVRLGRLAESGAQPLRTVPRIKLAACARWSEFWHEARAVGTGVEVGEIFEVRRGQVTGNNALWVYGSGYRDALPAEVLRPTVTRARELLDLDEAVLRDSSLLKRVIDLPADWSESLDEGGAQQTKEFLKWAEQHGGHASYIARHRKPWFRVRLGAPAPILMTYMARRPPRFVRNMASAAILNIAHGLYPRQPMAAADLDAAVRALNDAADIRDGRAYAGNLVKFEPGDAMRIRFAWPAQD
jgi:predicted RNA methylase